jgi:hypothetical protein
MSLPLLNAPAQCRSRRLHDHLTHSRTAANGFEQHVIETDEERRTRHRRTAVASVKRSSEYLHLQTWHSLVGTRPGVNDMVVRPLSPDPEDLQVSKRQWEHQVQRWRILLRSVPGYTARQSCPAVSDVPMPLSLTRRSSLTSQK